MERWYNSVLVITTDKNGTASYIEDGISGLVFESDNALALANKIDMICSNTELYNKIIQNSANNYNLRYSENSFYSTFTKIITKEFNIVL